MDTEYLCLHCNRSFETEIALLQHHIDSPPCRTVNHSSENNIDQNSNTPKTDAFNQCSAKSGRSAIKANTIVITVLFCLVLLLSGVILYFIQVKNSGEPTTDENALSNNSTFLDTKETKQYTGLEREALTEASKHLKVSKIGQSHYVCHIVSNPDPNPPKGKVIIELRNATWKVEHWRLTEAQKLNGFEWTGKVRLEAKIGRHYILAHMPQPTLMRGTYNPAEEPSRSWSQWYDHSAFELNLTKFKGTWTIKLNTNSYGYTMTHYNHISTFETVSPSIIPK